LNVALRLVSRVLRLVLGSEANISLFAAVNGSLGVLGSGTVNVSVASRLVPAVDV
jgi:hypothetical protein